MRDLINRFQYSNSKYWQEYQTNTAAAVFSMNGREWHLDQAKRALENWINFELSESGYKVIMNERSLYITSALSEKEYSYSDDAFERVRELLTAVKSGNIDEWA